MKIEKQMTAAKQRHAIGIDLGGTTIKYALISDCGEFLFEGITDTPATEGAEAVLKALCRVADECVAEAANRGISVEGIGIGTPGIISPDGQSVLGGAENIEGWENVNVGARLTAHTGLFTLLGNDANLMALGETLYGAAAGAEDVVFLTVGTGIGGGVLIGGNLQGGWQGRGMELGHVVLVAGGERCACGAVGCLEHYASTSALVRRYAERKGIAPEQTNGRQIVAHYHEGEPEAIATLEEHWEWLGQGIRSFINIFAPQKVVVGGGISEAGEFYFEGLRRHTAANVMDVCGAHTEIVAALLGNQAGSLGAAGIIFQRKA